MMGSFLDSMTDEEKLHVAMINSYDVIVNNLLPESIIVEQKGIGLFAHDFQNPLDEEEVSNMIGYFISIEEYEKCAKLDIVLKSLPNE